MQFWQHCCNFLTKERKLSAQCPAMIEILDSFFWQPCWKKFNWMPKRVCSVCENDKMYLLCFSEKLLKMNPSTGRKQFAQPCQKFLPESRNFFRSFHKTIRTAKIFSKKYFSSKVSYGHVGFSFDISVGNLLTKNWKVRPINENEKKYIFFSKILPLKVSLDT